MPDCFFHSDFNIFFLLLKFTLEFDGHQHFVISYLFFGLTTFNRTPGSLCSRWGDIRHSLSLLRKNRFSSLVRVCPVRFTRKAISRKPRRPSGMLKIWVTLSSSSCIESDEGNRSISRRLIWFSHPKTRWRNRHNRLKCVKYSGQFKFWIITTSAWVWRRKMLKFSFSPLGEMFEQNGRRKNVYTSIRISPSRQSWNFFLFLHASRESRPHILKWLGRFFFFASSARTMCSSSTHTTSKKSNKRRAERISNFYCHLSESCPGRGQRQPWRRGRAECAAKKKKWQWNAWANVVIRWKEKLQNLLFLFFFLQKIIKRSLMAHEILDIALSAWVIITTAAADAVAELFFSFKRIIPARLKKKKIFSSKLFRCSSSKCIKLTMHSRRPPATSRAREAIFTISLRLYFSS